MTNPEITVAIVDDQTLLRQTLAKLINQQGDLKCYWQGSHGKDAITIVEKHQPDVLLLDIRMTPTDGLSALRYLTRKPSRTRIIMLTMYEHDSYLQEAIKLGAHGYLLKDSQPHEILTALRQAPTTMQFSPAITRKLAHTYAHTETPTKPNPLVEQHLADLTKREIEVLTLIQKGYTNQEIADHLVVSIATVKTHINNLIRKTSSRNRAELVIFSYEHLGATN